ncbi:MULTISPECIES: malto-oligosyltrehalose trehalohydrolase [Pseudomonas]|uniref:Malto-oligosyltrehalose trehalohydrolase n=1 Tax=Pseudomonas quercus TaxID=2722792 RepID=A0ABX0YFE6_9PSED|nr:MULTISPECIES: malto-oligosyltrehalose trehalohydrolase [Pseudomonas]MBF7143428.1 malto-oligosyltrehalose trehalohydrolase [Pseudomonas sp. LY10J]NJP01731.1 malto-oligosyltrehalose trehalohydrolase [Pseudomonas quercus]
MADLQPVTKTHGAIRVGDNLTRFALWAPDATAVQVLFDDGETLAMNAEADGWYVAEAQCDAGTAYRYKINDDLEVPDPASRAQQSDVHSASVVVDHASYPWRQAQWQGRPWHEAVIYEVHVGLMGGFEGVMKHLPRLEALGITAIELMPIAEFPGDRNWGYDGVLPYAPEHAYGTPDQLKALIDKAHEHGLMVILDVVYNHFGPDGNFLHAYAKGFFNEDKHTPWGAAIDFSKPQVREFFIGNALMWLFDYRFDGLRFDAVHAIESPDFLQDMAKRIRKATPAGRHIWLNLENEHNEAHLLQQGFDAQWNDDGHNALHVLLTGETEAYYEDYAQDTTGKLARCLGEGFVYQGHVNRHGEKRGEPSGHLNPTSFVLFLQNHDQIGNRAFGERLSQLSPEPALRAATTLLLASPMVPLMFMGDEWGASEPFQFFTSFHGELAEAVRNGRRSEFKAFSAFQDPERRAKIPDPNAKATFDASRPAFDQFDQHQRGPWVELYVQLLSLRRRDLMPGLPGAVFKSVTVLGEKAVSARWKLGDGSIWQIDLNLNEHPVAATLPFETYVLFDSRGSAASLEASDTLPGYTALVSRIPADAPGASQ